MSTILYPVTDDFFTERENEMINYLRTALLDTDEACQIFDDGQLLQYLDLSLQDVNSHPMKTFYTMESLPRDWINCVVLGGYIFALNAQGLIERARNFNIADQGVSYTPPALPDHMQNLAQFLETKFQLEKEKIKANEKPLPMGLGTTRVLAPNPTLARLRHLRAHRML